MKYIGIDIGTTNIKACLYENGAAVIAGKTRTPIRLGRDHAVFFDIREILRAVDTMIEAAAPDGNACVSFSSVGESVVPLASGAPAADPLVWYDRVTDETQARMASLTRELAAREVSGTDGNPYFSLYKMRWLSDHVGEAARARTWLPISSLAVWHRTGVAACDYTQASRTLLLDIRTGDWNRPLFAAAGIPGLLPRIAPCASYMGDDRLGNHYFLGGHDHLTGYAFLSFALPGKRLLLDSIGTSESILSAIGPGKESAALQASPLNAVGILGDGQTRFALYGLTYSGKILENLAAGLGMEVSQLCLEHRRAVEAGRYFAPALERDLEMLARECAPGGAHGVLRDDLGNALDAAACTQAVYAFLARRAARGIEVLSALSREEPAVVAAGPATGNTLLMRARAKALGRRLVTASLSQTSAFGAAYWAARGAGDAPALNGMRDLVRFEALP